MSIVLTLQPDETSAQDTYISSGSTGTNFGTSTTISLAGSTAPRKGLIKFDLSSIPSNAVIESAVFTLRQINAGATTDIRLYRSLVDWFETGSTWNHRNTSGSVGWAGGVGGAPDSEYSAAHFAAVNNGGNVETNLNFTVTSEVAAYVNGSVTNRGWWIMPNTTAGVTFNYRSASDATATLRPKLVVTYSVPEPIVGSSSGTSSSSAHIRNAALQYSDLSADQDVRIVSQVPGNNFGVETQILVGRDPDLDHDKGLIKFNLENFLGANLLSATLRLYCTGEDSTTDRSIGLHRSLVEWFEGTRNNTAPGVGENASTWNHRNTNGSVAWTGGAGGAAGSDYATTATDTQLITGAGTYYEYNVTADVASFLNGTVTNHGWWLIVVGTVASNRKYFASSEHATADFRPVLTLTYQWLVGTSPGSSVTSGTLTASSNLAGSSTASATVSGRMITNEFIEANSAGSGSVSGTMHALAEIAGTGAGSSSTAGDIVGGIFLAPGSAEGIATSVGDIKGVFGLAGLAEGSSSTTGTGNFSGSLRGNSQGIAIATAFGYAKAIGKARVINCYPTPLLYLTDGATRQNGQLNLLNFLADGSGYKLQNWRPSITQYKDGGRFSNSPLAQGRRLTYRAFDNAIEVFDLSAVAIDQNALIEFQQELMAFQEVAADYWVSNFASLPVYLVAKAARENNERYAIVHMISVPELENPYQQPFFQRNHAAFQSITVRIERGHWTDSPPGDYRAVNISSQRSWTVSGWTTGS